MPVQFTKTPTTANGYFRLDMNGQILGMIRELEEGYLVGRRRKSVATIHEAAKQLIDDHLNRIEAERRIWCGYMDKLKGDFGPFNPGGPSVKIKS